MLNSRENLNFKNKNSMSNFHFKKLFEKYNSVSSFHEKIELLKGKRNFQDEIKFLKEKLNV